jgi:hypothetical protein
MHIARVCIAGMPEDMAKLFHETFAGLIADAVPLCKYPSDASSAEQLGPSVFAVRSDKTNFSVEAAVTRTVRLVASGSREVYCVSGWDVSAFLSKVSINKQFAQLKDVARWLKNLTEEQLKAFGQHESPGKHQVWHATMGPQDAMVAPVGWCYAERMGSRADVLGYKTSVLRKEDLSQLEEWRKVWISQGVNGDVINNVVDKLTLLD